MKQSSRIIMLTLNATNPIRTAIPRCIRNASTIIGHRNELRQTRNGKPISNPSVNTAPNDMNNSLAQR